MHEEPIDDDDYDGHNALTDRRVLALVVEEEQRPWAIEEIVRALQGKTSKEDIEDAIARLRGIGLLNQAAELVFASQAATHLAKVGMLGA
jgi:hypothetical protein